MQKRKADKKVIGLESHFESILVCNDKKIRPYIEIFVHEPENVTQRNLGTLLGIFSMDDFSEDSSYIVNYLVSVIKKEYFSKIKRAPIESFEAALHKANLALSRLAEHENISWIGKLSAIVAIIEKNNLHLTQTGTASALLLRARSLSDVSEGLAPDELEPNPLKTFVNVASGRLEKEDRLIITTREIFNIFSPEEIKKSALNFSPEKFVRFLRTALTNELEKAAVLTAEIKEQEEIEAVESKKGAVLNAFSQNTFADASRAKSAPEEKEKEYPEEKQVKNGHIYIKADRYSETKISRFNEYAFITKEHFANFSRKTLRAGKRIYKLVVSIMFAKMFRAAAKILKKEPFEMPAEKPPAKDFPPAVQPPRRQSVRNFFRNLRTGITGILPNFTKIKAIFSQFNYQQKIYAFFIVLAIIFMPLAALRLQNYIQNRNVENAEPVTEAPLPLKDDKNVVRLENLNEVYESENIFSAVNLAGRIFGITRTQITDLQSREFFAIPAELGQIKLAAGMDDLNLLFLISQDNKAIAWSPISKNFQVQVLEIPANAELAAGGTYLTYLYLLDKKNSQIYRYPRAGSGFGVKTDWLKEAIDLSSVTGLALSENIFTAGGDSFLKLFKGRRQDFSLEPTATPIISFKVYTRPESQNIYILDKQNARIIKLDANGAIQAQYYHPEIANAGDFAVDEAGNNAYVSTAGKIFSFAMN